MVFLLLGLIAVAALWAPAARKPAKESPMPELAQRNDMAKPSPQAREAGTQPQPIVMSPIELIVLPTPPVAPPSRASERTAAAPAAEAVLLPPPPRSVTPSEVLTPPVDLPPPVVPLQPAATPPSTTTDIAPLRPRPASAALAQPAKIATPRPQQKPRQMEVVSPVRAPTSTKNTAPDGQPRRSEPPRLPEPSPQSATEGRSLLRILERGSGPSVTIAWPASAAEREDMYGRFVACFGMRMALADGEGRLYMAEGQRGRPWPINLDQYSGFIRQPDGDIAAGEAAEVQRIRAHHGTAAAGSPVRVFPRRVDAALIGGLRQAVGPSYLKARTIRAEYRFSAGRILVGAIAVDGAPVAGTIDLSGATSTCRGSSAS